MYFLLLLYLINGFEDRWNVIRTENLKQTIYIYLNLFFLVRWTIYLISYVLSSKFRDEELIQIVKSGLPISNASK